MKSKEVTKKEESTFLNLFETGQLKSVKNWKSELERYQQATKFTVQKMKSINIRLAQKDVAKIKAMAARHGLPYQTFITSVLHKISADR